MISQQRIDELLFSEPNMVKVIRQVEQEVTAELRERAERAEAERDKAERDKAEHETGRAYIERDALRALAYAPWAKHDIECIKSGTQYCLLCKLRAALREGGK